jgi:hypothetical protein
MPTYLVLARRDENDDHLPLGTVDGSEKEKEGTTFRRFFGEQTDPLLASGFNAKRRTFRGHPLVRRLVASPHVAAEDHPDDVVRLA